MGDAKTEPVVSNAVVNENQFSIGRKKDLTGFDADRDGLLDIDEQEIFGTKVDQKDSDGDGVSDFNELRTLSDPLDKESFLMLRITYVDGKAALIVDSPRNSTFHVESTESLGSGEWIIQDVGDHSLKTQTEIPLEGIGQDKQRYYRVRIEQ